MKTLIELYDERPIENILGTEMFRPEETIFICPPTVARDMSLRQSLEKYFVRRGCKVQLTFVPVSLHNAENIAHELKRILSTHEDCVIDISGGTDAALFAAGKVSGDTPVITYSITKNTFFEIHNAPFDGSRPCHIHLDVESVFLMAGGTLMPGRMDTEALKSRLHLVERLFAIYGPHRKSWNRQISYLQKLSSVTDTSLQVSGPKSLKADNRHVTVDEDLLRELHKAKLIKKLNIRGDRISFSFRDEITKFWLRDMGCALELHVYRACVLSELFDDVVLSAVVKWNAEDPKRDAVSNEIDVVAVRGVFPVFISCKTCEIHTEALNELAILRDRFGGKGSRAIIVTSASTTENRRPMLRRAGELGIEVIEWRDLALERLIKRLKKK